MLANSGAVRAAHARAISALNPVRKARSCQSIERSADWPQAGPEQSSRAIARFFIRTPPDRLLPGVRRGTEGLRTERDRASPDRQEVAGVGCAPAAAIAPL